MAFLREITERCNGTACTAAATVELYDCRNARRGMYCRKCGARRLKALQAQEDAARAPNLTTTET